MNNFFEDCDDASEVQDQHEALLNNLNMLKGMSVEESTFYKKWVEVQGYLNYANQSDVTKAQIWRPTDIMDKDLTLSELDSIDPEIVFVDPNNETLMADWLMIRVFVHSMPFDQTPGRFLRFLVRDKTSGKYLGATSVSSDVIVITKRDEYIGWTKEDKLEEGRLNNSAIGSCIMSTQPFGYNFLGSKLVASMVTSKNVRDVWEKLYDNKLVGMTTTSLYGSKSFYNGVPCWRKCGSSAGKISIKPDDKYYTWWHDYIKKEKSEEYTKKMTQKEGVSGPVTGAKQRVIQMIFSHLKIKASNYTHGFERGVYYANIYDNTREFLQGKVKSDDLVMKKSLVTDVEGIVEWWRPKAKKRYLNLLEKGLLKPEISYYSPMINCSYSDSKDMFLSEVGR